MAEALLSAIPREAHPSDPPRRLFPGVKIRARDSRLSPAARVVGAKIVFLFRILGESVLRIHVCGIWPRQRFDLDNVVANDAAMAARILHPRTNARRIKDRCNPVGFSSRPSGFYFARRAAGKGWLY